MGGAEVVQLEQPKSRLILPVVNSERQTPNATLASTALGTGFRTLRITYCSRF